MVAFGIPLFVASVIVAAGLPCLLMKIDENAGLPGRLNRNANKRGHGSLIRVAADPATLPDRSSQRRMTFETLIIGTAIVLLSFAAECATARNNQEAFFNLLQSGAFPLAFLAIAIRVRKALGFVRGLFRAALGSLLFGALFASPFVAVVTWLQYAPPLHVIGAVSLGCAIAGMASGIYFTPVYCRFHRMFEDGYSDRIDVSHRSFAFHELSAMSGEAPYQISDFSAPTRPARNRWKAARI